jgi:hypothetical protein
MHVEDKDTKKETKVDYGESKHRAHMITSLDHYAARYD